MLRISREPIEMIGMKEAQREWIIVGSVAARVRLSDARAGIPGAGRGGAAFEIGKIARCAA